LVVSEGEERAMLVLGGLVLLLLALGLFDVIPSLIERLPWCP
jgi:hypothetical protein